MPDPAPQVLLAEGLRLHENERAAAVALRERPKGATSAAYEQADVDLQAWLSRHLPFVFKLAQAGAAATELAQAGETPGGMPVDEFLKLRESDAMKWISLITNLSEDAELQQLRERTGNDVEALILRLARADERARSSYVQIRTLDGAQVRLRRCRCGSGNLRCGGEGLASMVDCLDCGAGEFNVGPRSAVRIWNERQPASLSVRQAAENLLAVRAKCSAAANDDAKAFAAKFEMDTAAATLQAALEAERDSSPKADT